MSTKNFRVKRGLNIEPIDPLTVQGAEAGDIIIDSTDENTLKLFNPSAGEFETISGGGGQSSTLMSDFEKLTPTVSNVVAVADTVTFLPIDDNKKSVKATFSGSNGTIRYEVPVGADLEGVQGIVTLWIKTSVENLTVVATKDGVAQNNGLQVNSSNKWRQYEVPVVFGDADYGFEVRASGAVAGDVYIDEAFVKVQRLVYEAGEAHFVGEVTYGSVNCQWINTTGGAWGAFPVDSDCNGVVKGSVLLPDTKIPAVKITNVRTDGYYKISLNGVIGVTSGAVTDACAFSFSTSSSYENNNPTPYASVDTTAGISGSRFVNSLTAEYRFSENSNKTVQVISYPISTGDSCSVWGMSPNLITSISVHFYPDDKATIVQQSTELTAKTANSLTFRGNYVAGTTTHTLIDDTFGVVSSVTPQSSSSWRVDFTSGLFTTTPSVNCEPHNSSGSESKFLVFSVTPSSFFVQSYNFAGSVNPFTGDYNCTVTKSSADYNKSATIVGKFENINSSELVKLQYKSNGGQSITANVTNITWSTKDYDNYNAWNGTQFTAPKSSYYTANVGTRTTSNSGHIIKAYINGADSGRRGILPTPYIVSNYVFQGIYLNEGDILSFRSDGAVTLEVDSSYHVINITELPDTESIIKNLNDQKTKCQRKSLTADVSTNTTMSALTFTGLVIGKKYSINGKIALQVTGSNSAVVDAKQGASVLETFFDNHNRTNTAQESSPMFNDVIFTSTGEDITFVTRLMINNSIKFSQNGGTWVRLCELPDTYVETDEW